MTSRSWIRKLFGYTSRTARKAPARYRPPQARLALEALETRDLPSAVIWYVNDAAAGANTGQNWNNAFTDLQSALTAAKSGDQVWVAQGTYKPTTTTDRTISFVLKDGVGVYGGFAGTETALWQRNWGSRVTILSGDIGKPADNSDNSYHVVTAGFGTPQLSSAAVLDGFTITGGNANGTGTFQGNGAGLFNNHGALTVSNLTFTGNTAASGGGMDNEFSSSTLTNVVFSGNTATYAGGGLYDSNSTPTLTNVLFTGNHATWYGGGLENDFSSSPTLRNVTFSANTSSFAGGAMYGFQSSPTLTNCILWGDAATRGAGEFGGAQGTTTTISFSDVGGGAGGTGNINADPLFVDAAHGDLHLQTGSPAIDAGTNTGAPAFDLEGHPRPLDGNGTGSAIADMGAFEAKASPTFSALLSPGIVFGTAATTFSGHLASNVILPPVGEVVSITLGGVTQTAALDGNGNFTTTFSTAALGPAGSPYAVTYRYAGDAVFNPTTGASTLAVSKANPTITWANPAAITYGTALSNTQLDATANVPGSFAYTPPAGTILGAGTQTLSVTFTPTDTADYSSVVASVPILVNQATLKVTANNATRSYGAANPTFTDTITGFVNGDLPSVVSGTPTLTTTATASSAPGNYAINVDVSPLSAANYIFQAVNGTLTINPAPLSATAVTINVPVGVPYSGPVATFTNADPSGNPSSYSATITWGDGSTSAATISDLGGGTFAASGSHTYTSPGSEAFSVQISHNQGFTTTATANGTATVSSDVVLMGTGGNDTLSVIRSPGGQPGEVTYIFNGAAPVALHGATSFTFYAGAGNVTMTISLADGGPLVQNGAIAFHGGAGTDTLNLDAGGLPVRITPGQFSAAGQAVTFSLTTTTHVNNAAAVNAFAGPDTADRATALAGLSAPERFVQALYLDELGRAGSKTELDNWVNAALNTPGGSQKAVVAGIAGSREAEDHLVRSWYIAYLGRQANGVEEQGWVNLLHSGQSEEQVLSLVLGDTTNNEFYKRAQTLGLSRTADQNYVQALYQVLLDRPASSTDLANAVTGLKSMARQGLALALLDSPEFRTDQFDGYYSALLHRPADAGLAAWLASSLDVHAVRVAFESSSEFFSNG
jgi:hypothetical protein